MSIDFSGQYRDQIKDELLVQQQKHYAKIEQYEGQLDMLNCIHIILKSKY